ncbi:hypothetical protein H0E84_07160 [Luteimonas sp. SJ-92]|uniref:Uncharacterized protein n=1 Tax=Luteimonas salinisoli TaxID=2752307 RepID=A0A853JAE3_9GAMM|nr:hypothetical protein [Luteimonas salinisoli]NZA26161.1 hypothetical protein [Luteimonas salinisoli]
MQGGTERRPRSAAMKWLAAFLLLALACPVSAQEDAAAAAHRAWLQGLVARLADDGGPRDLALAALLRDVVRQGEGDAPVAADPQTRIWRETAFARAGTDVVALNLIAAGAGADEAVRGRALARWRQLEPGNLAPWLLDDGAGVDASLGAARTTRGFNGHFFAQLRAIVAALDRHPPAPEQAALLIGVPDAPATSQGYAAAMGMSLLVARTLPALQPLSEACREAIAAGPVSERGAACRSAARLLAGADMMLLRMVGLGMAEDLAADADAQRAAREARRRFDWQMLEWGRLSVAAEAGGLEDLVRLLADPAITGEPALVERLLTEAGIPLQPPAGWQPPRGG